MSFSDTATSRRSFFRWLLRELSTDDEDMIAFVRALPDGDDEDAQVLLEALANPPPREQPGPLEAAYQTESQLLLPAAALKLLDLPRATFYALLKRGTFPMPVLVDDAWLGWPRGVILEWADPAVRKRLSMTSPSGYAPFERAAARPGNGPAHPDKAGKL